MARIDMGFVEKCESWRLESRFFPNKIGGKPAWLDLKNLPSAKNLECKNCNNPCLFLCQIYAPYEDSVSAFHRTIFIFICSNNECCKPNDNGNLKILRSQLSRDNKFYPFQPPDEREDWRPDITVTNFAKVCRVCYLLAPSQCGKCKLVNYCCRQHQIYDWKDKHKEECNANINNEKNSRVLKNNLESMLFPEYELIIESDTTNDTKDETSDLIKEEEEIEKFNELVINGEAGTLQSHDNVDDDLNKMTANEDEVFMEFQSATRQYPDQVLRYERGGLPLYISSENQPSEIPRCEKCGGERQFEFQIMPQLLNYLNLNNDVKSLDWGILAIFTCKNSCDIQSEYCPEYIWKQDII